MKRKSSARVDAAQDPITATAADIASAAGEYVLAAADRMAPYAQQAVEFVGPYAHQAAGRVTPYAQHAVEFVSPYAHQAAERVTPYALQAAERVGPLASTAKQRGAQAAHDAVQAFGPRIDEALERVSPAVEAAREKMTEDLLPRLSGALSAAAAPVVVEATKRGRATVAAARGELSLPEPEAKRGGRWLKRLAIVAALAGVVAIMVRKVLGNQDADWQAARPTTPYAPSQPAAPARSAWADTTDATAATASADPDAATTLEAVDDVPETAAAVDDDQVDAPLSSVDVPSDDLEAPADDSDSPVAESTEAEQTYEGEGVYVGSEPPEGFTIKGNERSMKYHTPESGGYVATTAEVWFNSEEAAQAAGFVRAQT